jgi:nitroimidazol reductase NimA-like FMN-containing flavoprotein (pyridoxamine 5'-phosphate oxidase superfamily)
MPDIFPVNYVVQDRSLLFGTARGTKLLELTVNRYVAFEVDRWDEREATSVVARGVASVTEDWAAPSEAEAAGLRSWSPTAKTAFVRIRVTAVEGRRMRLATEPADHSG